MREAIPLIEFVPVYKYENDSINDNEYNSDWVKRKKELGDKGELIIKEYLENECDAIVEKQKDSAGFDFKVVYENTISYVEVKTTSNREDAFYMSRNEIRIAKEKGSDYCIYFVTINGTEGEIHIIINPFDMFGLNKIYNNDCINDIAVLKMESVRIKLLDLNKFILLKKFSV